MNQGSGLECLPRLLLSKFLGGERSQLVVDQRQELLRGVRIALLDGGQDARNPTHWRHPQGGKGPAKGTLTSSLRELRNRPATRTSKRKSRQVLSATGETADE